MDWHRNVCFCGKPLGHLFLDEELMRLRQTDDAAAKRVWMEAHGIRKPCCSTTLLLSYSAASHLTHTTTHVWPAGPGKFVSLEAQEPMYAEDGRRLTGDQLAPQLA